MDNNKKIKHKKGKLMILDGNALIHRSFHALPPTMATKTGEMTNAVYGFTTVLIKAMREFKPDYIALTLDRAAPTFRHKEYKEYKANRIKAPDDLYNQFPRVRQVAGIFNIPIYEKDGFEADDLIGTIAAEVNGDVEKIIVTGDLDTLQLVNDHTKVYTMKRGLTDSMIYDEQAVKQRYGLDTNQMIDYKALRGDPSDNIPGVRGIGEKTATELLQNFKTLEGVYNHVTCNMKHEIYKIKPRIAELLIQYKEDAFMSKSLATIKCDVKIKFDLEKARFNNIKEEEAAKLFSELEFSSLLPRIKELGIPAKNGTSRNNESVDGIEGIDKFERNTKLFKYYLIDNDKEFDKFLLKLKKQKEFAFDTETANRDSINAELLGISFSWKEGEAYYVKVRSKKLEVRSDLFNYKSGIRNQESGIRNDWIEKLKPILEDEKIKKIGHNIKFDIKVMACYGIHVKGVEFDTMIASYLLNPGTRQHNLNALTFTELGHQKISKKDLLGSGREKKEFSEVSTEKLYNYSCEDADFTYRLAKKLLPELKKQKLYKLFNEIEMPLVLVLAGMEMSGIMLDNNFLAGLSKKINNKINQLTIKIYQQANSEFNINSTQQLRKILFEKLEIPADNIAKNKTGFSTGADELAKLKDFHPIIKLIQEYRELNKLATTYVNAFPKLINPKTGRLHTSFNQSVTATGRLSSTEPNLQNIPIRTELGREIRKAFIADKGCKLLSLDYSQIELRLAAHMSGDEKMIKAFKDGADIHQITAAEINQVPLEEATPEMRRQAKAINFGILYGQGPHGLAQSADIPYARAKEFIEQYFAVYTGVKKYIDKTINDARQKGYTETLFNRRRYLPEINSSMVQVRKTAERMAINTPIQGTAADMIKMAMIEIHSWLHSGSSSVEPKCERLSAACNMAPQPFGTMEPSIKMLLQVHDELLFEVKDEKMEEAAVKIKKIMENIIKLKVPILVDVKVGNNWGEMEEVRSKKYGI